MFAEFNTDQWPIVHIHFNPENITEENYNKYTLDYLSLLLRAKEEQIKIIILYNLDKLNIQLNYIKKIAGFNKSIKKYNYVIFVGIITKRTCISKVIKMYLMFDTPICPFKVLEDYNELEEYMKDEFELCINCDNYRKCNDSIDDNSNINYA